MPYTHAAKNHHRTCAVEGCSNGPGARFHSFPPSNLRRKQWLKACGRPLDDNRKDLRVCTKHFLPSDYHINYALIPKEKRTKKLPKLAPNACPNQFIPGVIEQITGRSIVNIIIYNVNEHIGI